MNREWEAETVIRDGKRSTYKYRNELYAMGFRYDKNSRCWRLKERTNHKEVAELRRYCRRRKLNIDVTSVNLIRGAKYREKYFEKNDREYYLCAYCGKKMTRGTTTVDHIIPIGRFKNRRRSLLLNVLGIKNVNENRNLAPACEECNRKKGRKGGLWILRGMIGKHHAIRKAQNITRTIFIAGLAAAVLYEVMKVMETII